MAAYALRWFPAIDGEYGGRQYAQSEAAATLEVSWATLRTYIEGYRYLMALEKTHPAIAHKLSGCAIDVVRAVKRWSKRDQTSAFDFVRKTFNPSSGQALRAERAARASRADLARDSFFELVYSRHGGLYGKPKPALLMHLKNLGYSPTPEPSLGFMPKRHWDSEFADFRSNLSLEESWYGEINVTRGPKEVSTAVVANMKIPITEGYAREAKTIALRAIPAAILCPLVILPFPDAAARDKFLKARPEFAFEQGQLPKLPIYKEMQIGRPHGDGPFLFPGPQLGAIIATTAEAIVSDLFE